VVTPSNHRVHHGQNDYCIDKNYGGVFSIWDRMFGTYADERDDEKPVYGIRKPIESWNPLWANLHHFVEIWQQVKSAENWRHRLMYIFAKPSWTPEKEDATEVFDTNKFSRFDTPATVGLIRFAFVGTLLGSALLMVYFYIQTRLPQPLRVTYCVVMVLAIAGIGWRMTRARQVGESNAESGYGHA